ncbi:hypothetical protein PV08_06548 [Exophiala spinifera]|uniref:CMP/dCMP-type deaminase domain-containing protein n=1 Tax=Exophiala spinifera TaxID=91928 RepID=A0A0D2BBZ3_9EURO|nr:uncharacterized protein PV08_06548 [Exophiala spinifera]KIW16493.1 hypothetical protein PV08_06548 [Exophiala spinifera]
MSYQSFLKATSNSKPAIQTPSPSSIQRKPPVSASPTPSSVHSATTHNPSLSLTSNPPFTPASSAPSPTTTSKPLAQPEPSQAVQAAQTSLQPLTKAQIDAALETCLSLQNTATKYHEKRPFAALLLGPDNSTVLLTHYSISHVQHAETELARLASIHFSQPFLAGCTLVSTWEPCAMCTGTLYWSNIGRLVYAASEEKLNELTGGGNDENMTMSLPCRDVLKAGQKDVKVIGPVSGWEERVIAESGKWWRDHQSTENGQHLRAASVNGSEKPESVSSVRQGTPTTWTGEDSVLSRIDDEGEYKADLDIDWMR